MASNFFTTTGAAFSSKSDEWETPRWLFDALDEEFGFTLDPCSTHSNAKCREHFTQEEDGLARSWAGHTVFCNPPYGRAISSWVAKCREESRHATVVLLIPARTDTAYFHDHIYKRAELRFLRGRLKFERGGGAWSVGTLPEHDRGVQGG